MTPHMQPPPSPAIQLGSVGWVDDGGTFLDLADSGNDGANLVRVTLYAGRTPTTDPDQTQAQGHPILCRLADGIAMPSRGTTVVVAIPGSHALVPGGAVIIATLSNNPQAQANAGAGEMVLQVPGSPAQIFIRQNGTIVFKTADAKGNTSSLKFGPGVFQIVDPAFQIDADQNVIWLQHWSGASFRMNGLAGMPSPLSALGSQIHASAGWIKQDAPLVMLGPDLGGAGVYMPATYGPPTSPASPLAVLLTALTAYQAAVAACIASLVPASGVTTPEQAAVAAATTALTAAIVAASAPVTGMLSSNAVKVSTP